MQNIVKLQDGIIMVSQVGDQTRDSILGLSDQIKKLSEGLEKVLIIVDLTRNGKPDMGARKAGLGIGKHMKFDRMALYGASPYMTGLINLIARSAGRRESIRLVKSQDEALAWLR